MPLDQERLRQLKAAEARELAAATNLRGAFEVEREIDTQWAPPPAIEDKDTSFLGEAGRAVWGAIVDAVSETELFVADMFSGVSSDVTSELLAAGLTPEQAQAVVQRAERGAGESIKKIRSAVDVIAPANETTAGNLARGVGQFLVPFLGWSRVVRAAGVARSVPNGFIAGFATDITAFDPNAGNLSALVEQFPALSNPVTEFLATSPDDDEAVNRLRNALEGLAIGGFLEPFVQVLRLYRMRRAAELAEDARVKADTEPAPVLEPTPPPKGLEVRHTVDDTGAHMVEVEGGFIDAQETDGFLQVKNARVEEAHRGKGLGRAMYERLIEEAEARGLKLASDVSVSPDAQRVWASLGKRFNVIRNEAEVNPETGNLVSVDPRKPVFVLEGKLDAGPKVEPEAPPPSLSQRLRAALQITPQQRAALIRAVEQEDYSTASGLLNFNEHTIDWESLDEGDNVRQLLNTFSEIIAENIDTAKGGVQTLVQTQRLAALVGTSADQVHRLYRDTRGNKGLTARVLAAERTMLASAQRLLRLAQEAKNAPAEKYSQARLALHRHVELHAALLAEVKGSKTEIARALHAMRLMKSAAEESFKEFDEILRTLGGHADGDAIIDALLSARSLRDMNTVVTRTRGRRWRDALIEISVNGLLSQPKTHLLNMASNALNAALMTGDRYLAGMWRATKGDLRLLREANADLVGKLQALDDAFRLALRAFRDGMPITDVKQRVEVDQRRAITHELFKGVDESSAFGRIVNLIGSFIRLPGRFLMAGDEFFKTINVRGETAALAYRQAVHEAERRNLKGAKFDQYVQRRRVELFTQPSPTIMSEALKRARYATFQEAPRTAAGMNLDRFVNSSAFVKIVIVPFFRTPMNILRQAAVDRTPFALLLSNTRRVLAQGGPEADIMAARMFTGMGALVAGYSLVSSGGPDKPFEIVGKRPIGNTAGEDGVLDYSIRLGDTWFQFNRLDPVGTWLGMMADIKDYMELEYDPADPQSAEVGFALTQAAFGALLKNTLNKSWFASVQEILDAFQQIEKGKPETVQRAVDRLLAGNAIKLVPYSAALRGGSTTAEALATGSDVEVKEAWSFVERLQSNFAFLNDGLPPKRDYLGRPITRHNSAWFAVNPFATSPESADPLDRELARLAFDFQILPKSLDNGKVPLNAAQYSELKRLIGQEPFIGGQSLEQVLRDLVTSDAYMSLPSDQVRIDVIKGLYEDAKAIAVEMLKEQNGGELRRKSIERQFGEVSRRAGQPIELPAFPTSQ